MKRILIVDHSSFVGGAEIYATEIARQNLCGQYEYVFAVTTPDILEGTDLDYEIFHSSQIKTRNIFRILVSALSSIKQLLAIIKKRQVQIVQTNTVRMHLIGVIVAIVSHKPLVWVIHSYDFPIMLFTFLSFIPVKIVFVSETIKTYYASFMLSKDKAVVVLNGFDFKKDATASGIPVELNETFSCQGEKVGIIGRIEHPKGQECLIKSFSVVIKSFPRAKLYIVGDIGPGSKKYYEDLISLIKTLNLESNVEFLGYVANVAYVIDRLDLIVQCSVIPESFGRVICESMAQGKAVVATRIGGFCELIDDNENGVLVTPDNSTELANVIVDLLSNSEKIKRMGESGMRKVTQKYQIQNTICAFNNLYENI